MASAHADSSAVLLPNGKVMMAGGYSSGPIAAAEVYDPVAGTWAATTSLVTARYYNTVTLLANGKVLVAGGTTGTATTSTELYDVTSGSWAATNAMTTGRFRPAATLLPNGKVLVAGGQAASGVTNSAEIFDPSNSTWTVTGPLAASRNQHTITLLANGKALVAGGFNGSNPTNGAELFDSSTGTWTSTGSLNAGRHSHTATVLADGRVVVAGGQDAVGTISSAEIYYPSAGAWTNTGSLATARKNHSATLLPNGKVLVAGGQGATSITNSVELYDLGLGYTNIWQPQITNFTSPLALGTSLVLAGSQFRGISEGGGGSMLDSSSDYPVVQLRNIESGQVLSLTSTNWNTNSFTSLTIATNFPQGYALLTMFVNGIPSTSSILSVAKQFGTVTLNNLAQTYDGTAKSAGATTTPSGLAVNFTYNGSASAPTNAGSYTVVGTISNANYQGGATNTLVIGQAAASVSLGSLSQIYNGTARSATATTSPTNLAVNFTYNGSPAAPTNVGSYTVVGLISDVNYFGGATNTLVVGKAAATVTLGNLAQTYDGAGKSVSVTTSPTNLTVNVTYNGSTNAPTNVGSYTVIGIINEVNYQGSATNTLVISCPVITVNPSSLNAVGDGYHARSGLAEAGNRK